MAELTRSASGCMRCWICRVWWRALKWLPVLIIVSIVGWSYYAYVVQLCLLTMTNELGLIAYLVTYHILLVLFMWAYASTIYTDVVPVPAKFKLPASVMEKLLAAENEVARNMIWEHFAQDLPVITRTKSGTIRYCKRCLLVKPDRAHHCSMCGVCVLKMDHHCHWVNNCICFHNYKNFMLFLGYAFSYCIFIVCTTFQYFIQFWRSKFPSALSLGASSGQLQEVFLCFLAFLFGINLISLLGYHCYLMLHNRTTLEAFRAPMFCSGAAKNGFSIGKLNNFKEVFGRDPKLWFIPIFTSTGEGISYPQRQPDEDTESLLSSEQCDRSSAENLDSSSLEEAIE